MTACASILLIPCADGRFRLLHRWTGAATGLHSVGFGAFLIYEVGFAQELFRL